MSQELQGPRQGSHVLNLNLRWWRFSVERIKVIEQINRVLNGMAECLKCFGCHPKTLTVLFYSFFAN